MEDDSDVASLLEQTEFSRATMKRLTLVRRPTEEGIGLFSPTKLVASLQKDSLEDKIKETLKMTDKSRSEEIFKQNRDYVEQKAKEAAAEMEALKERFENYTKSTADLIQANNQDFLTHLQQEVKRRVRDKSDMHIGFNKVEDKIAELGSSLAQAREDIFSLVKMAKATLTLVQMNSMLSEYEDIDKSKEK